MLFSTADHLEPPSEVEVDASCDRGDGPIGLIIGAGVFLAGFMMVIYLALAYHGQQILAGATQEGAVFAARLDGDPNDGKALTSQLISSSGGSLIDNLQVSGPRFETNAAGDEWVVIEATGDVAGPLGPWSISATGSAPVEQFAPQPG